MIGSAVSGWSDAVKGRTQKELRYGGAWKKCPGNVDDNIKYSVDKGTLELQHLLVMIGVQSLGTHLFH